MINHIGFLEKHLNQYEKIHPISTNPLKISDDIDYEEDNNYFTKKDNVGESKSIFFFFFFDQSD